MLILLILFVLMVVCYFIGCFIAYKMIFYCNKQKGRNVFFIPDNEQYKKLESKILKLVSDLNEKKFEQVFIKANDGTKLSGRLYEPEISENREILKKNEKIVVDLCFHGWRGNCIRDFCGGARIGLNLGHKVFLVEERAQGLSEGRGMTFGAKERFDLVDWVNYIIQRFGTDVEINLIGVSMGAATVLMASSLDLPDNVTHIVADSPYTSPRDIIRKVCGQDMKLPYWLLKPIIYGAAFFFAGFNLNQKGADNLKTVENTTIPILIIHGEEDLFVPCKMSEEIASVNPKIKRETFPEAGHCLSYMKDTSRYENLVGEFLKF